MKPKSSVDCLMMVSAISTQYVSVTDEQTDRHVATAYTALCVWCVARWKPVEGNDRTFYVEILWFWRASCCRCSVQDTFRWGNAQRRYSSTSRLPPSCLVACV